MITEFKTTLHKSEHATLNITGTTITIFSMSKHLIKVQVENHGYCMTIMQVGIVACLGMKKAPGRSAVKPRKELPKNVLSRRGLNNGKGIIFIFTVSNHSESMTNRMGSTKQRSECWFHLTWSYG